MVKIQRGIIALLILAFMVSCQTTDAGKGEDLEKFSQEYAAVQQKYNEKFRTAQSRGEFENFQVEQKKELEVLLKKYGGEAGTAGSDEAEILKGRILLNLGKPGEAEKKIQPLLEKGSKWIDEARMVKILILFSRRQGEEALKIFREIEKKTEKGEEFFNVSLYFAFRAEDPAVRKEYSEKLLGADELPEMVAHFKPRLYANLSAIAREKEDLAGAKEMLKKALSISTDPREKSSLESELAQLEFIGKPAPPISAETWINSGVLSLDSLKGKVVVIDFWATWCAPCRFVIPILAEEYTKNRGKGLEVIGFTKLYGIYRDDKENKGKVSSEEEKALTKEFIQRHQIPYPVAISNEGKDFEVYKITAIPTMVFINKRGEIDTVKMGVGNPQFIQNKIKELLEEE